MAKSLDHTLLYSIASTAIPIQCSNANHPPPPHFDTAASLGQHRFPPAPTSVQNQWLMARVEYDNQLPSGLLLVDLPSPFTRVLTADSLPPSSIAAARQLAPVDPLRQKIGVSPGSTHHHHAAAPPPMISMRRLSRLSLSALDPDEQDEEKRRWQEATLSTSAATSSSTLTSHHPVQDSLSIALPRPSWHHGTIDPNVQYTHHGMAYSYHDPWTEPTPLSPTTAAPSFALQQRRRRSSSGLVGSYEESLLSGHMAPLQPSKPILFHGQIGVLGQGSDCPVKLKCPRHLQVSFPAFYYQEDMQNQPSSSPSSACYPPQQPCWPPTMATHPHQQSPPYVGTLPIEGRGYRLPLQGRLQIAIQNPNKAPVHLFLVPYDVRTMPCDSRTFLRQKSYGQLASSPASSHGPLKFAVHLHLKRTRKGKVYLYQHIRVIFVNRRMDSRESYHVVCEGPEKVLQQ
ncbi:hypothetical protein DM01DRAFT_1335971 [Hesseltinella vesiculosa]|uniref:Atos-like conserved domain-containing protein n=1 Tax=Hesseltinella vesiculosa TaxID=101127 RepID=A0A1X2GHT7_9FUNG|nr:hypothetical protein DM01DRAFT_1335971 [Hesseltinella vesiculosa]